MTRMVSRTQEKLLLPAEVADLFRVDPKTVTRWVLAGKIGATKTLGGHNRFHPEEVRLVLIANYTGGNLQERLDHLNRLIAERDAETAVGQ